MDPTASSSRYLGQTVRFTWAGNVLCPVHHFQHLNTVLLQMKLLSIILRYWMDFSNGAPQRAAWSPIWWRQSWFMTMKPCLSVNTCSTPNGFFLIVVLMCQLILNLFLLSTLWYNTWKSSWREGLFDPQLEGIQPVTVGESLAPTGVAGACSLWTIRKHGAGRKPG